MKRSLSGALYDAQTSENFALKNSLVWGICKTCCCCLLKGKYEGKKSSEIKFRVSLCWKLILKVQQFQSCKYCKVSGANTKPNMASVYCKSRFYLLQAISQKKFFSHLIKRYIVRSCNNWAVTPRCVFPSSNLDQVLGDTDLFSIKRRGPWEVNWPRCESHGKRPPRRLQMA